MLCVPGKYYKYTYLNAHPSCSKLLGVFLACCQVVAMINFIDNCIAATKQIQLAHYLVSVPNIPEKKNLKATETLDTSNILALFRYHITRYAWKGS